jgi:membrane protease YdiL (CAAX protease family)
LKRSKEGVERLKRLFAISILLLLVLSVFVFPLDSYGSSAFYVSLAFFAIALVASSWKAGVARGLEHLGLAFRQKDAPKLLVQSFVLFAACGAITVALSGIFYLLGLLDTQNVYEKVVMLPLPVLIVAFTLAPLGEEAFFRGFLFRRIAEWLRTLGKNAWIASAIISSIIFALLHASYGSIAEIGVAFAIGMTLCAGVKMSNSLVPAVLAHASFNFVSIVMAVVL